MKLTINQSIIAVALITLSIPCFALKDDSKQPITVLSESQALDMKKKSRGF